MTSNHKQHAENSSAQTSLRQFRIEAQTGLEITNTVHKINDAQTGLVPVPGIKELRPKRDLKLPTMMPKRDLHKQ